MQTSFPKFNSEWITNLNMKCKAMKFLEDNIGENLDDLGMAVTFRHDKGANHERNY